MTDDNKAITVEYGKYTFVRNAHGLMVDARRNGVHLEAAFERMRHNKAVHALLNEIERLRADLDTYKDSCSAKADRIDRLGETVEKLRADLDRKNALLLSMTKQEEAAPTPPAPQRKPLSEEEIKKVVGATDDFWATSKLWIISITRAVERAHGME